MNNSQNTYTVTVGIIAAVLVFVLFIVIIMTQGYGVSNKTTSSTTTPRVEQSDKMNSAKKTNKTKQSVSTPDDKVNQEVTVE